MDTMNPLKFKRDKEVVYIRLLDQTVIKGTVHIPVGGRLSDLINSLTNDKPFLAVTDAHVMFSNGAEQSAPFISVNRSSIGILLPTEDKKK